MKKQMHEVVPPPGTERAILVGHAQRDGHDLPRSMEELRRLADTAGAKILGELVQRRGTIHPAHFLGKGKVLELKDLAAELGADVVVFNDDLSPPQVRNLEKMVGVKVVDRSEIILDIFARRARTRESRLQVELAQLEYTLPRLTGMWKHLERQAGGIGSRGPGETQLETDRRLVNERIARLKRELKGVERERETQRRRRRREFRAALVGYTNAGKSTLFNKLVRADVFVEDRLFATLDATTRQLVSPDRQMVLLTDTVGFIRKLPHRLVEAFKATLEEVLEADLLLHVVDVSHPKADEQIAAVNTVLAELGEAAAAKPTLMVFNKIDRLGVDAPVARYREQFPAAVFVSARTGDGIHELLGELGRQLRPVREQLDLRIPHHEAAAIAKLHALGQVLESDYEHADAARFKVLVPPHARHEFERFCLPAP